MSTVPQDEPEEVEPGMDMAPVVKFPVPVVPSAPQQRYQGLSHLKLTPEEGAALMAPFDGDDHDILPTGEVYVSQVHVRRRLNGVIGIGQWGLMPAGAYSTEKIEKRTVLYREYHLYVRGHFVAETVGESEYYESNDRSSWATASEVLKSNALTRACKDLGIASECWDRHWTEAWKKSWAVRVWAQKKDERGRACWRRKDASPLPYEQKILKDAETPRDAEPAKGAAPTTTTEVISTDQATVLIDTAREHKVPRATLDRIVADAAGVSDYYRIPKSRYAAIVAAVEKYEGKR